LIVIICLLRWISDDAHRTNYFTGTRSRTLVP
jgi:hypothetical protein